MDLDRIKHTWQNAEIKPAIDEQQIQQMLDTRSKSAYRKLLIYDIIGVASIILLTVYCIVRPNSFDLSSYIILITLFVSAFIWQIYKVYFLKKIDFMNMSILEVSEKIVTYKKWISKEWIAVIICALFVYVYGIALTYYKGQIGIIDESSWILFACIGAFILAIALSISYLVYIATIKTNIQIIEESIKEIEEFQKGNKEVE